jgi:hypothetical protein
MFTVKGKVLLAGLIAGSLPGLINAYSNVVRSLENLEYGLAGFYIGNIVKSTLDYEI